MVIYQTKDFKMEKPSETLKRLSVKEMDNILGLKFPVLNNGFIRVIDYMGGDSSIVQAARISYGKGTKKSSQDRSLIRYLMRHWHSTPFEMCELKLHVRVPMDTWRQWIRHRTANVNEYSTRYSIAIEDAQETGFEKWRIQSASNKQGSEGFFDIANGQIFSKQEKELHKYTREVYYERLSAGMAREQARKDLPLSTYTEAYWKIDLHNLLHFLRLRMDSHAQLEIREYANTIGYEIVSKWCPIAWEAFLDYRFEAESLSRVEIEIFKQIVTGGFENAKKIAFANKWIWVKDGVEKKGRECLEFEEKLRKWKMTAPW